MQNENSEDPDQLASSLNENSVDLDQMASSQKKLICIYTVFKTGYILVQQDKG